MFHHQLQTVQYDNKTLFRRSSPLNFQGLCQLLQKFDNYEGLILQDCPNLTSVDFINLFATNLLLRITTLRLNCCIGVDDSCLTALSESALSLQNLKILDLSLGTWFTNEGLKKLLDSSLAMQIKELVLSKSECVDNQTLNIITSSSCLHSLEVLSLEKCYEITSHGISSFVLSKNASNLKKLDLTGCWRIHDEALEAMIKSQHMTSLEELNLSGLTYITNLGIKHIAFSLNFKNLKALYLAGCYLLDDKAVEYIAESSVLTNLEVLNLNYNSKITSIGIEILCESENITSLQYLYLKDIYLSIRADKAMALSKNLSKMKSLSFNSFTLNYFMTHHSVKDINQIHFGPSVEFPENMTFDYNDDRYLLSKKVFIEKSFPYDLKLPIFKDMSVFCISVPDLTDEMFHQFLSNSQNNTLRVIKLVNLEKVTEIGIQQLLSSPEFTSNLKSLEFRNIKNLSNQCLKVLSKNKVVKLNEFRVSGDPITSNLPKLDVSGLRFLILSPVCENLKTLELKYLGLEEDVLKYIAISEDMMNLEELILDGNFRAFKPSTSKDQKQAFKIFFGAESRLKSLKTLSLRNCPALSDNAFKEIYNDQENLKHLPNLECIRVNINDHIRPELLKSISQSRPELTSSPHLVLKNIINNKERKESFDELFTFCYSGMPLLRIELVNIHFLTDQHLVNLLLSKHINLLRVFILKDSKTIDGTFLGAWANEQTFSNLHKLHFANLSVLQEEEFEKFFTKANLENLAKLEIQACSLVTNQLLKALGNSPTIKRLRCLTLANLREVTDQGINDLVQSPLVRGLRTLILKDLNNLQADTFEGIAKSTFLEKLLTLKVLNCRQIDSSKSVVIFDSLALSSLASFTFDNPIIPNDTFLKSFVFTKLRNLITFSLKFSGEFPRDGILELLRRPNVHLKHVFLTNLVGSNLQTIVNDELIDLLIKSDFIDVCLSINTSDNPAIHRISAEKLLNFALHSEFSLEKFILNYGNLIDDDLLIRMGQWKIKEDDYWRKKELLKNRKSDVDSSPTRSNDGESPQKINDKTLLRLFDRSFSSQIDFPLRLHNNFEIESASSPNTKIKEDQKNYINFLIQLPTNFNFKSLEKVTAKGITAIIPFLSDTMEVLSFMDIHQEVITDDMFATLIKKASFKDVTSISLEKYKLLTEESLRLMFESKNPNFYAKMFEFSKPLKYKLNYKVLKLAAKSKQFLNVKIIKLSKANMELNCWNGLDEIMQTEYNRNVTKLILWDVYATHSPFEILKESPTLENLHTIVVKNASSESYINGLEIFIQSPKFSKIRCIHLDNCLLTRDLVEALGRSEFVENLSQLYFQNCLNAETLVTLPLLTALNKLTDLKLSDMFMPQEFFENLATSTLPLEQLVLHRINLNKGDHEILILISQMQNSKIKKLKVDGIIINNQVIEAMNKATAFVNLEYLSLSSKKNKARQRQETIQPSADGKTPRRLKKLTGLFMFYKSTSQSQVEIVEDFSLPDFQRMINSPFMKNVKFLKLLYKGINDAWIESLTNTNSLGNLIAVEFHPECKITSIGMAMIIEINKETFKKFNLPIFIEKNFKLVDDALILYLCRQNKLFLLNYLKSKVNKITSEGIVAMLNELEPRSNPNFKIIEFLELLKNKVNLDVLEALSNHRLIDVLFQLDVSIFPNIDEKSKLKFKVLIMKTEEEINAFLREVPKDVDDEFINVLCKCPVLDQQEDKEDAKFLNIKLDANIHTKVTSKGLNTLIKKMCEKRFTVYHDWVLLDSHWRNLLNQDTLNILANDSICKPESLDLVNELEFENNFYISTNGYQDLIREEIQFFRKSHQQDSKDKYFLADTEEFFKGLNKNRFTLSKTKIDDEIGLLMLKIIKKCKHLKKINLKGKNFGNKFCRKLSIILWTNSLHFLEEIDLRDNPRITSEGLKYIYTAVIGNDYLKRVYLACDATLQPEINTIVDDGLYIYTKKKLLALKKSGFRGESGWSMFMCFYLVAAFPFALWQCYEDRILNSRRLARIKKAIKRLEVPFISRRRVKQRSILPISQKLIPHLNQQIDQKAQHELRTNYEFYVPKKNFYFTKNMIKLNEFMGESWLLFLGYILHFIAYNFICIAIPILYNADGCENGLASMGFIIYGIYAVLVFLFEVIFFAYMVNKLNDKRALSFSCMQIIHLFTSQSAKFDFFTDVMFIVNTFDCGNTKLAVASTAIIGFNVFLNVSNIISAGYKLLKNKGAHYSSNINRYTRLSLALELHSIGEALDKFSTSNSVKFGNVGMPQIMATAITRFVFEDFPQFVLQMIKLFVYGNGQANIGITLTSTILSLILSFRTAMIARPSICKPEHVEKLIKVDGRRLGQARTLEENHLDVLITQSEPESTDRITLRIPLKEEEEDLLGNHKNLQIPRSQQLQQTEEESKLDISHSFESNALPQTHNIIND